MFLLLVVIWIICAAVGYNIGSERRIGGGKGFALGLFFGLIGLIIVVSSPRIAEDRTKRFSHDYYNPEPLNDDDGGQPIDMTEQIKKWHDLKLSGAITDQEFEDKKRKLLE